MSEPEISRMLTISPHHLSQATLDLISQDALRADSPSSTSLASVVCYPKLDYGWFVYPTICVGKEGNLFIEIEDIPNDLRAVFQFMVEHACEVLCIDSDGSECDGLPILTE